MAFDMHRVFFATPLELEEEREACHAAATEVNERLAMPRGVLLVTVSLPSNMGDKRAFQNAVVENIQDARYYVLILEDSWGPPMRNFERDYALALKYAANPDHKTKEVLLLFKAPLLPHRVEPDIVALKDRLKAEGNLLEFEDTAQLRQILDARLRQWLESIAPVVA